MKATELLEKQHKKTKAALKKLEDKYDAKTLDEVASELAAHMVIEETIFYPAVRKVKPSLILEAFEEHAIAQLALKRLLSIDKKDESFAARATTLRELLEHHIEEEEDELFPKASKALGDAMNTELGAEMLERFEALVKKGHEEVLPTTFGKTTSDASATKLKSGNGRAASASASR